MKSNTTSGSAAVALAEFARLPANSVLEQLGVTRVGLNETAVQERTEEYGQNKVAHEAPPTWYFQLAHAFWNPFIGVLLALGILSYLTGDIRAVIVISVMVTISALLRFFQEFRSNQAALALQAIVRTRATVERINDVTEEEPAPVSTRRELPIEAIVPGGRLLNVPDTGLVLVMIVKLAPPAGMKPSEASSVATRSTGHVLSPVVKSTTSCPPLRRPRAR